MATLIRYKASFRGLKKLRGSRGVDEALERRAHSVAAAAESYYGSLSAGHGGIPPAADVPIEVLQSESDTNEPRARVAVIMRHPRALRIEEDYRVLGGSLDAAR